MFLNHESALPFVGLLLIFIWALGTPARSNDIQQRIEDLHERYRIDRSRTGIHFRSLRSGESIYAQNIDTPFVPASNMKLVTAFAALNALGSNYMFHTELYVDRGDQQRKHLYVRGTGDPTISRRSHKRATDIFKAWATTLKNNGHSRFKGHLFLDSSAYEPRSRHSSWSEYQHTYWYTAPVHALNFNDNCVLVRVRPRSPGEKAEVQVEPEAAPVTLRNRTKTVTDKSKAHIEFHRLEDTWTLTVKGGIRPGTARTEWITIPYPPTYFGTVLKSVFEQEGLPISGPIRSRQVPDRIRSGPADISRSTPLNQLLTPMLKESQNLYAETIFKQLSYQHTGKGSWTGGSKRVRTILRKKEIPTDGCIFVDGSGLSRQNRLTPRSITGLLNNWVHSRKLRPYIDELAISGRDGTMEHRLNKSPYRRAVAAKTGTLSGVRALSGVAGFRHLNDPARDVVLFSIIVNEKDLPPGNARVFVDHVARLAGDIADLGK